MKLINYPLFEPPIPLRFKEMTKKEAQGYFDWFIEHTPHRIRILGETLQANGGSHEWIDFSHDSCVSIGKWLEPVVQTRTLLSDEMEEERKALPTWFHEFIPNQTLTDETISLCVDLGIYFAESLRMKHSLLNWTVLSKPASAVDLHQPVVVPFRNGHLNPIRILTVICFKQIGGKEAREELPAILKVWDNLVKAS